MIRRLGWLLALIGVFFNHSVFATTWSAEDYDLYSGDFDGDGVSDLLYIAKAPGNLSGIARGVNGGFDPSFQSWPSNYLGISWSGNQYTVIILQNSKTISPANKQADILLQSNSPGGNSFLLSPNQQGRITAISQPLGNNGGQAWSSDQHRIVAGDFNGDGLADVFLQATSPSGSNAIMLADSNAQFTASSPAQPPWSDGFLGFKWATSEAIVYSGDFNGDGYADLLIQARPRWVTINYDVSFPVPTYPTYMNGIAFSHAAGNPFSTAAAPGEPLGYYAWSRFAFGVDWSPLITNVVVGKFNGTSYTDIILQALHSNKTSYLVSATGTSSVFSTGTALASNVTWSADTVRLISGQYAGTAQAGVYLQSLNSSGTNSLATGVTGSSVAISNEDPTAPPPNTLPVAAGRLGSSFSVSNSGAANYTIPIWMPPGVGALQPSLSLSYSSRGADGIVGVGWSVSGMSVIARCNRTWAQDGSPQTITLTSGDRFCLDSAELKLTGGSAGLGGSTYASEIESFSLITANGSSSAAPTSFTVTTKNGLIYDYGTTTDSQIMAGSSGPVRAWALSQIRDRVGNTAKLSYYNDAQTGSGYTNGTYRIKEIDYPYTASGQGPYYSVTFAYSSRASGVAFPSAYVAGSPIQEPNQLNTVSIQDYGAATPTQVYSLNYAVSPTTQRLRLSKIQECSSSECYPATTVGYQDGAAGWNATRTATQSAFPSNISRVIPIDLNGDGVTDLVYPVNGGSGFNWYVVYGVPGGGFGAPQATNVSTKTSDPVIPADFTAHGSTDLLYPSGGTWWRLYWNGSALATANTQTPLASAALSSTNTVAADVNGDGLPDLVYPYDDNSGNVSAYVELNTTIPGGALSFGAATLAYTRSSVGFNSWRMDASSSLNSASGRSPITVADFNGDGRADLLLHVERVNQNEATHTTTYSYAWIQLVSAGTTFAGGAEFDFPLASSVPVMLDWNGDGCTDVAIPGIGGVGDWNIAIAQCTGNGLFVGFIDTGIPQAQPVIAIDWDGDGRQDLLTAVSNGPWQVAQSTGTGVASALSSTGITSGSNAWFVGDFDGDGQDDLGLVAVDASGLLEVNLHKSGGARPDLATTFADGLNIQESVSYVPITQNNYSKCSGAAANCATAQFPEVDFQGPLYVVNQFTSSDGTGGTYQDQFWYYGARFQAQGRGFEGFYARRTNDSRDYDGQNRLYTFDYLGQVFPYTGMPYQRLVSTSANNVALGSTSGNVVLASGSVSSQLLTSSGQGSTETRYFPFVQTNKTTRYEYGALSNGPIATELAQYSYGDGYGNLTNEQATVTDDDPTSPFYQSTWQITVADTYLNDTSSEWCIGLPTGTTVTSNAQGQGAQQRTYSFTPDSSHALCRVKQKTAEPNTPSLNTSETLSFDTCGNVSQVDIVGHNADGSTMTTRTTKYNYTYFTQRCQFPEAITDALNEVTTVSYNYDFGTTGQLTDPNSAKVTWNYDDFGRLVQELRPDGTMSRWSFKFCVSAPCWGFSDLRYLTIRSDYDANSANYFTQEYFYDGLQRLRFDESNRALGLWTVNSARTYDSYGRVASANVPFSLSSNGSSTYNYDLLGRVTSGQLIQAGGGVDRTYSVAYSGRTTRVTDPLANVKTYVTDVAGLLRRVTDPLPSNGGVIGATTAYDFDDFGNLSKITDAVGAVWSASYNLRGFRYQVNDPNAGAWNLQGDSLNELTQWTDAKNQTFKLQYDLLGRVWQRVEPEGTSTWTWGNSAAASNIGSLQSLAGYGYQEAFTYDSIGRLYTDQIATDQLYQYDYSYNSIGAIDTVTYPASTAPTGTTATRFKIQYSYSYGTPVQISDITQSTPTTVWSLLSTNDSSLATVEILGPVSVAASYSPLTSEITGIRSGVSGSGTNRQNLSYQWDKDGNLQQRQDVNQNLTEGFTYDALNRLTGSTLNNVANFSATYTNPLSGADQAGNIIKRSDVGSYSYDDPNRPHGVTSAGGYTYSYDANGNVVSRNGLSLSWASYNLPTSLQATANGGTYSSQFLYGPDRERYQQTAQYSNGTEITSYAGGLFEKVTGSAMSGTVSYRHYVPTPTGLTAIVARNSDGSSTTAYALRDHLGSSDAVVSGTSGQTGNVLLQESFGAFGQRRQSNWSAAAPGTSDYSTIAQTTRRGFTFQEHLDNIGLIHMNGRVYDPIIGRFLSADPLMGDLTDSQSLNAYAYVGNRPLSATDPTGQMAEVVVAAESSGDPYVIAAAVVVDVVADMFGGSLFGAAPPPPPPTTLSNSTAQNGPGSGSAVCLGSSAGCGGQPNYLFASNQPYAVPADLNQPTSEVVVRGFTPAGAMPRIWIPPVGYSVEDGAHETLTVTQHIPPTEPGDLLTVIVNGARGSVEPGLGHPDAELTAYAIAYGWGSGALLKGGWSTLRILGSAARDWLDSFGSKAASDAVGDLAEAGSSAAESGAPTTERLLANPVLHDHHLLPQQFRGFFSKLGIDIDEHTVTVSDSIHLRGIHGSGLGNMPGKWNQQWARWIEENPNATAKDVYQQLGRMMDEFGLSGLEIHPYGQ